MLDLDRCNFGLWSKSSDLLLADRRSPARPAPISFHLSSISSPHVGSFRAHWTLPSLSVASHRRTSGPHRLWAQTAKPHGGNLHLGLKPIRQQVKSLRQPRVPSEEAKRKDPNHSQKQKANAGKSLSVGFPSVSIGGGMNPWKNGILSATPPPETDSPISRARASPFLGETSWLAGRAPAADP